MRQREAGTTRTPGFPGEGVQASTRGVVFSNPVFLPEALYSDSQGGFPCCNLLLVLAVSLTSSSRVTWGIGGSFLEVLAGSRHPLPVEPQ